MGWFRRQMDPDELDRLKVELAQLREAVDAADQRRRAADDSTPIETGRSDDARFEELAAKVADLDAHPLTDPRLDGLASKLAELDERVTSVSTELANQLSELGSDIDKLAHAGNGDAPAAVVLDELHDGQVRLANEQARYQIAFREDLARVAEQLRRP